MALITEMLLTNNAYGYPNRGDARRIKAALLVCMHITDNATNIGPDAAEKERNYANRSGSNGPSAHYYLNRDGSGIKAIDPIKYAAWSNGIVSAPKTNYFGYNILNDIYIKNSFNANEAFLLEIECCGSIPDNPVTQEQKETMAQLIAQYSISYGIDINRDTVLTHSDVNTTNRKNDPVIYANKEAFIKEIIALASQKKTAIINSPVTIELAAVTVQLATCQSELTICRAKNVALETENTTLKNENIILTTKNTELEEENQQLTETLAKLAEEMDAVEFSWKTLNEILGG